MIEILNFFKARQKYPEEVELQYTRVDKDTYRVSNGHSTFSIRVVTSARDKQLEKAKKSKSTKLGKFE